MPTEDFQGPQGAEVPRMQDPGVLQHRGAARQPVAGASAGWCTLRAELVERRLLSKASNTDLAGQQESQEQPQKSTGQPFPAGAQGQDPHGWGKRNPACSYHVRSGGWLCVRRELGNRFFFSHM